ncbi:MAG TPA: YccF domain-containing protein [Myxococcaceae bacterium]|nr:YccF domain-containing protein [Myxococcaceae bacterium]
MRLLLNILWIVLGGGFLIWLEYLLGGLLLCLTIVGIPFGVQCFKVAGLALLPFGKEVVDAPGADPIGCVLNGFWLLVAGVWIFLSHLGLALGLAVTIIGIPFAIQHVKLAMLALAPFGKRLREA